MRAWTAAEVAELSELVGVVRHTPGALPQGPPAPAAPPWTGRRSWMGEAVCAGRTRLFYATDPFSEAVAVRLCRACPVLVECAAQCVADEDCIAHVWGTRAGLRADERRALLTRSAEERRRFVGAPVALPQP